MKLRGRTVVFDTVIDFSIGDEVPNRIVSETLYKKILSEPAYKLNEKQLPLYKLREGGVLDSFVSLIVVVKDKRKLKFSHGGTGVIQVFFEGRFEVEARAYSGPSIEFTLREV